MNIQSSQISVFPLSKNRTSDRSARLFYENNVANLIRQVVDVEGFLITKDGLELYADSNPKNENRFDLSVITRNPIIFNLYGYYFNIAGSSTIFTIADIADGTTAIPSQSLYAAITIDNITNEIAGFDNGNVYEGLLLTTDIDVLRNGNYHYIKLLDFKADYDEDSGVWVVNSAFCESSYQKLSPQSLDMSISKIDGKH